MKKLTSLMLALLMLMSFAVTASAAQMDANGGIQVAISTDADAYFEAEPIEITVQVKNNNSFDVKNIAVETILPDGLHAAKGEDANARINLAAGEMKKICLTAYADRIPDLPSYGRPDKNDKHHNSDKGSCDNLESDECLPTDPCDKDCAGDECLPTDECKKDKECDKEGTCKGDGSCDKDCYCKQPCTGDSFNAFLWIAVLMFAVAAGVLVLKGNKKAIETLCVVFCLLMALAVIPVDTLAASNSVVVDTVVQVGYYDYTIKAKVSFDLGGKTPAEVATTASAEEEYFEDAGESLPVDGPAPEAEATTSVLEAGFEALSGALSGLVEDGTAEKLAALFSK